MVANTTGPVALAGKPAGRKKRLHVPHEAAASATQSECHISKAAAVSTKHTACLARCVVPRSNFQFGVDRTFAFGVLGALGCPA